MTPEEAVTTIRSLERRIEAIEKRLKDVSNRLGISGRPNCPHCGRLLPRPNATKCGVCGKEV